MAKQSTITAKSPSAFTVHRYFFHVLVFAFSFLLYFNSTFNEYNLDDELVTQNHRLTSKGISAIPEIFRSPYYADEGGYRYEYRPLVLVTFAVEHSVFGENTFYSHLINVLLYAFGCLLLFAFLKKLLYGYNFFIPLFASLLFVAHPVHTEVVDSIKNRDEILVLLFGLCSMYAALLFVDSNKSWWLTTSVFCLLLAMLAKPTAAVFVFLVPFSLLMFRQIKFWKLALVTTLLYLPAVVYSRVYFFAQQVMLLAVLQSTLGFLYFFKNSTSSFSFKNLRNGFNADSKTREPNPVADSPESSAHWVLGSLLSVTLAGASILGILIPLWWLFVLPFVLLLLAYSLLNLNWRVLLLPAIAAVISVFLVRYKLTTSVLDASLFILLFVPFLSNNKRWKVSSIIGLLIYATGTGFYLHSSFTLAFLAFAVFINRKWLPFSLLIITGFGAAIVFTFYQLVAQQNFSYSFLSLALLLIVFAFLWFNKEKWVQQTSVWLIPVSIVFLFTVNPLRFTDTENIHVDYQLKALQFTRGVDLTPANTYRPLKFIESPVTALDPLNIRIGTAMKVLGNYLKLVILPYPLNFYYGYPYISATSVFLFVPFFVLLLHVALALVALFLIRKKPLLSFSVLFYLASVSVFSTLLVPIPGMMGDRFLLIPSLGFCIAVTALLYQYFEKKDKKQSEKFQPLQPAFRYFLLGLLLVYSIYTFSRNTQWKNHVTLFRHDVAITDNSAQAHNLLGLHLFIASVKEPNTTTQTQLREEAITHFKRALELYPRLMNSAYDMARCYDALGKTREAYEAYQLTTQIDSTFHAPYFAMALYEHNTGNLPAATVNYEKFLRKYPFQMEAYANLSFAYFSLEQFEKSIDVNKRALKIYPNAFEPMVNIGKTFYRINQRDSALYYFEEANSINPNNPDVVNMIDDLKSK